jgi:KaiC/GvpD/RAD55 family RecA-like ATPase
LATSLRGYRHGPEDKVVRTASACAEAAMATKKDPEGQVPGAMPGQMPGAMPGQMPGSMPGAMPGQMPGAMPGQMPGMGMPGQMPGMGMPGQMPGAQMGYGANPMFAFMQMMNMFAQGGAPQGMVDPSAMPFAAGAPQTQPDGDPGLDADIIRPATLTGRVKTQAGVLLGSVLDQLCLSDDGKTVLAGVPQGCTIAFAGPPGKGKTRSVIAGLCQVAARGEKAAFIVAEEGFHDSEGSGRDDLCSRLEKIGRDVTDLSEKDFEEKVLSNLYVLEAQYHKGQSWDDFVTKYRYLVEKEAIRFVVIDSLNMLDPSRNRTADNLSALKTYNHEKGITCICVGQIRDTGQPVGGEALMHTADVVFLLEEMTLGSKEMAARWGGSYRDRIDVIRAVKSVTTPVLSFPVRVDRAEKTGVLVVHEGHPDDLEIPPVS